MTATLTTVPSGTVKPGTVLTVYGEGVPDKTFVMLVWNNSQQTPKIRTSNTGTFDTTFTVPSASKDGIYLLQCRVISTGVTVASTSITVQASLAATVPTAPLNLSATPSDTAVTLNWTAPTSNGGSSITAYKVYKSISGGAFSVAATLGVVLTWQDTGLTNSTQYSYQVSAVNAIGEGAKSAAALATPSGYTFFDDFNGTTIGSVWIRHYSCCGTLAGYDSTLASVANGVLSLSAVNRSGSWWSYLLDTKTTWTQLYGLFESRIKIPKGKGLWPAFWGYHDADSAEIDTMEICANPIGSNGGNDASLLHTTIHWTGGGSSGHSYRAPVDLSLDYHVYGVDWRSDSIKFYLDGVEVWNFTDITHIPTVALPLILNLGVGGSWCGAPDATTPSPSTMFVDWVRVSV